MMHYNTVMLQLLPKCSEAVPGVSDAIAHGTFRRHNLEVTMSTTVRASTEYRAKGGTPSKRRRNSGVDQSYLTYINSP